MRRRWCVPALSYFIVSPYCAQFSIDPSTNMITVDWVNYDGSRPSIAVVQQGAYLYITGSAQKFIAIAPGALQVVRDATFFFRVLCWLISMTDTCMGPCLGVRRLSSDHVSCVPFLPDVHPPMLVLLRTIHLDHIDFLISCTLTTARAVVLGCVPYLLAVPFGSNKVYSLL
jgi:hypothetical protein